LFILRLTANTYLGLVDIRQRLVLYAMHTDALVILEPMRPAAGNPSARSLERLPHLGILDLLLEDDLGVAEDALDLEGEGVEGLGELDLEARLELLREGRVEAPEDVRRVALAGVEEAGALDGAVCGAFDGNYVRCQCSGAVLGAGADWSAWCVLLRLQRRAPWKLRPRERRCGGRR
jgi:hypothetical protein